MEQLHPKNPQISRKIASKVLSVRPQGRPSRSPVLQALISLTQEIITLTPKPRNLSGSGVFRCPLTQIRRFPLLCYNAFIPTCLLVLSGIRPVDTTRYSWPSYRIIITYLIKRAFSLTNRTACLACLLRLEIGSTKLTDALSKIRCPASYNGAITLQSSAGIFPTS